MVEDITAPSFNHKRLWIIGVLFGIASIITLFILYSQFTRPNVGSIVNGANPVTPKKTIILAPESYTDSFATFNYPNIMKMKTPQPFVAPIVSRVNLSYPDTQTWMLNIEITEIPSGNLTDNSAYKLRISEPTIYELSEDSVNGTQIPIMIDTTSPVFNEVAFLVGGQYQATVALVGDDLSGNTVLNNCLQMILSSWQWHIE